MGAIPAHWLTACRVSTIGYSDSSWRSSSSKSDRWGTVASVLSFAMSPASFRSSDFQRLKRFDPGPISDQYSDAPSVFARRSSASRAAVG